MSKLFWTAFSLCIITFSIGCVYGYGDMASSRKASRPKTVQIDEVTRSLPAEVKMYKLAAPAAKTTVGKGEVVLGLAVRQLRTQYLLAAETPTIFPVGGWLFWMGNLVGKNTYAIQLQEGWWSNLRKCPPLLFELCAVFSTISASAELVTLFFYRLIKRRPTEDDILWGSWLRTVALSSCILVVWAGVETLNM